MRRVSITTDIRHAAGEGAIAQGSKNYSALKQWIDGGYARSGAPTTKTGKRPLLAEIKRSSCRAASSSTASWNNRSSIA